MTLFFIGDQLANFWKSASEVLDLPPDIRLVTEKQMATPGILTSLFAMYIEELGLKNADTGRFSIDNRMRQFFSTTHPRLFGKQFGMEDIRGIVGLSFEKEVEKILYGQYSIFNLLLERNSSKIDMDGPVAKLIPFLNEEGVLMAGIMIISNRYRINKCYLDEQQQRELEDEENIELRKDLQSFLSEYIKRRREERQINARN